MGLCGPQDFMIGHIAELEEYNDGKVGLMIQLDKCCDSVLQQSLPIPFTTVMGFLEWLARISFSGSSGTGQPM